MRKITQILRLKYETKPSHEKIARALGLSKGVVGKYVSLAKAQGLTWPLPAELDEAGLETRLFRRQAPPARYVEPDYPRLHQELKRKGVTLQLLWAEYAETHGDSAYRYTQFCHHYRQWCGRQKRSMRQIHRAADAKMASLANCDWIRRHQNLCITGPTGCGKTWLARSLGNQACRQGLSVRYLRMPRLLKILGIAHGDGSYARLMGQLAKTDLLILDDRGVQKLTAPQRDDLMEVIEDRYGQHATLIASQLPVEYWHDYIGEATLADAILDRLLQNAHRLPLQGDSMRKIISTVLIIKLLQPDRHTGRQIAGIECTGMCLNAVDLSRILL